jgi:Beta-lactamase
MELLQALDRFLAENVKGGSVDAQAVLAHVIRPPSGVASSDRRTEGSAVPFRPGPPPGVNPYVLNVGAFEVALDNALKDVVGGYVAQLRQSGTILFTKASAYAIRSSEPWSQDVRMHVASVSKLITAMAMMVLFRDNKISPDAQIINYLPDYWVKGSNVEQITFRNLFNHTSGLSVLPNSPPVDFNIMKSAIAGGIALNDLGQYNYQNLNYGLCRMLLPVINGNIKKDVYFTQGILDPAVNDSLWDLTTVNAYEAYLQAKVFQPSGVGGATLDHPPGCALAYRGPPVDIGPGWNSGNVAESCGCDGWHLSVNELLDVMGEFRRDGGILMPADAQAMLDDGFGVDPFIDGVALPSAKTTLAGNMYCKPGDWHDSNNRDEQSLAYFLPDDMELAVFVNSTVKGLNATQNPTNLFRSLVTQTYLDNLTTQPPINP